MSFRERAAWVMGILMALAGAYYLHIVRELGPAALPTDVLTPYTGLVIVAYVVAQIALSALSPREANAPGCGVALICMIQAKWSLEIYRAEDSSPPADG